MNLHVFFEKLSFGDENRFKESVFEIIEILGHTISQNDNAEKELLAYFKTEKYDTMLDVLWGEMMKELRSRINHLGLDAFFWLCQSPGF